MQAQTQTKSLNCAERIAIVTDESIYISLTMLKHNPNLAIWLKLHLTLHVFLAWLLHASVEIQSWYLITLFIFTWSLTSHQNYFPFFSWIIVNLFFFNQLLINSPLIALTLKTNLIDQKARALNTLVICVS